jgi:hypothetical protein
MDTTTSVVATGIVVFVGQWAKKDEGPGIKLVVGTMALAIFLSFISQMNEKLGSQFAVLILIGALLTYAQPIFRKLDLG